MVNHEPEKWTEFRKAYKEELKKSDIIDELMKYIYAKKKVTLYMPPVIKNIIKQLYYSSIRKSCYPDKQNI